MLDIKYVKTPIPDKARKIVNNLPPGLLERSMTSEKPMVEIVMVVIYRQSNREYSRPPISQ